MDEALGGKSDEATHEAPGAARDEAQDEDSDEDLEDSPCPFDKLRKN